MSTCQFFINNHCKLITNLTRKELPLQPITPAACDICKSLNPPQSVNRFTVCETLHRLRINNKFCNEKHNTLLIAVQCTLGVGTQLHGYLAWMQTEDCGCAQKVSLMNTWGPNECDNSREIILDWLKESAVQAGVPFSRRVVNALLTNCIEASLDLHTEYKMHWIYNV